MKLNKREKTWYDLYHKKSGTIQDRIKNFKAVDPYNKEGQALQEESAKKHGRAWYIFNGMNFRYNRDSKTWIEQFYVKGTRGRNKKKDF
tara:strand:+ start:697 stop:963 length:267 start_codon:yes stop_codon:yes gene_type:complete